jgi:hypothetical protein
MTQGTERREKQDSWNPAVLQAGLSGNLNSVTRRWSRFALVVVRK